MLLVRFSKPNYRGSISQVGCLFFFICCNFSLVSWWKVPILRARTALGGVTPWLEELCLFGVGVALGPPDGTNTQLFTLNLQCLQSSWSVGLPCMWRICEESMKNKRISKAIYICIWIYIYFRFRLLNSCEQELQLIALQTLWRIQNQTIIVTYCIYSILLLLCHISFSADKGRRGEGFLASSWEKFWFDLFWTASIQSWFQRNFSLW